MRLGEEKPSARHVPAVSPGACQPAPGGGAGGARGLPTALRGLGPRTRASRGPGVSRLAQGVSKAGPGNGYFFPSLPPHHLVVPRDLEGATRPPSPDTERSQGPHA